MHIMSTNFAKMLIWKYEYDVKIATSQTAHTKYKWLGYATEWKLLHDNFLRTPLYRPVNAKKLPCGPVLINNLRVFLVRVRLDWIQQSRRKSIVMIEPSSFYS